MDVGLSHIQRDACVPQSLLEGATFFKVSWAPERRGEKQGAQGARHALNPLALSGSSRLDIKAWRGLEEGVRGLPRLTGAQGLAKPGRCARTRGPDLSLKHPRAQFPPALGRYPRPRPRPCLKRGDPQGQGARSAPRHCPQISRRPHFQSLTPFL